LRIGFYRRELAYVLLKGGRKQYSRYFDTGKILVVNLTSDSFSALSELSRSI
jgi:hypothetical protein